MEKYIDKHTDCSRLYRRYTDAKSNWENWRSIYDEAYAYAIPERDPWPDDLVEGRRKSIQVYDITAVNATRRLVSRLHASLTPPGEQWFGLEAGDDIVDPAQKKEVNMYLQHYTDVIFQAINDSNFDLSINEMIQDILIGTGGLMIMESNSKKTPIKCKSVSINLIYPESDAYDDIDTVWRDFKDIYGRDITRLWPQAVLTRDMQQKMDENPMAKFNLTEGVVFYPETHDYRVVVMGCENREYILDKRTRSSPWIIARWSKCSNEVGGRGPVLEALPTIRSVNVLSEEIMRNVALSTSPPWMAASDGVFNPYLFSIEPNKIIPISRQSMGEVPLRKLDVAGDVNMGNLELNDLRMQIKEALYDNPIRPINAPEQTATETMIRQQAFMEEIGPAFGRLSVELLPKIANRYIYILQKKGYLPPALTIDNKKIAIRYKSPLVRSAAMQKIQNLQNYVAIMQPIVGQEMTMGSINVDKLPQWLGEQLDVAEMLVKSPAQIMELIQNISQASSPHVPGENEPSDLAQLANQTRAQNAGITVSG